MVIYLDGIYPSQGWVNFSTSLLGSSVPTSQHEKPLGRVETHVEHAENGISNIMVRIAS